MSGMKCFTRLYLDAFEVIKQMYFEGQIFLGLDLCEKHQNHMLCILQIGNRY